jgi:integrase
MDLNQHLEAFMDAYESEYDIVGLRTDFHAAASQSHGTPLTLAGLIAATTIEPSVWPKMRRDEVSALKRLASALGRDPGTVELSGNLHQFEYLLRHLASAERPIKGPNLRNIRSRCRSAFRRFVGVHGILPPTAPASLPRPPAWQQVAVTFPLSTGFSPKRFIAFAVENHWDPADVRDATVERYATTLADLKHRRLHLSRLIAGWNSLAADPATGLSSLAPLPAARQHYSPLTNELSQELRTDLRAYLAARSGSRRTSIRDPNPLPTLKPSSADKAECLLRQFLGLLRRQGIDITAFKSLADVVTLDHVEAVTHAEQDRTGDVPSSQLRNMLTTVSAIARHWTGMPEEDAERLADWVADHTPAYHGMTARNCDRLLMLKDSRNRKALLELPSRLMDLARRSNSERGAYLAQYAVAIELLLQTAMRVSNLVALRFGSQICQTGIGRASKIFVLIEADDVKNGEPIRVELPDCAAGMLRIYQEKYLPRLRYPDPARLFPGKNGDSKTRGLLGRQLSAVIKEHTGLIINPHLFRAIAVLVYLRHHPGDMATVQRILGDRQLAMVMKHYVFLDEIEARSAYQETIAAERRSLGGATTRRYRRAVR